MIIEEGKTYTTATGRQTTPVPKIDKTSNRKVINSLYRVMNWLLENAILEAQSKNDEFNLIWLNQIMINKKPQKVNEHEIDLIEEYLFDKDFASGYINPYKWTNKK